VTQSSVFGLVKFISYTEDITSVFKKHGVRHHLYADDKQGYMDVPISNIATARTTLQDMCSGRQQLVFYLVWHETYRLQKANDDNLALQLESGCNAVLSRSSCAILEYYLTVTTMKHHVSKVLASVNYVGCVFLARRLQHS